MYTEVRAYIPTCMRTHVRTAARTQTDTHLHVIVTLAGLSAESVRGTCAVPVATSGKFECSQQLATDGLRF